MTPAFVHFAPDRPFALAGVDVKSKVNAIKKEIFLIFEAYSPLMKTLRILMLLISCKGVRRGF
jgi:hypothetical protein